jgi:hypothetical protein
MVQVVGQRMDINQLVERCAGRAGGPPEDVGNLRPQLQLVDLWSVWSGGRISWLLLLCISLRLLRLPVLVVLLLRVLSGL